MSSPGYQGTPPPKRELYNQNQVSFFCSAESYSTQLPSLTVEANDYVCHACADTLLKACAKSVLIKTNYFELISPLNDVALFIDRTP